MTAHEFYRKRLIELSPNGIMNKINQVVNITTQVQICEEYHQYRLLLLTINNVIKGELLENKE
jgi:hypothetical protein